MKLFAALAAAMLAFGITGAATSVLAPVQAAVIA